MRAVLDTNVLPSGLLWHGATHELTRHLHAGKLALVTSPQLLAELADVLGRPKFRRIMERSATKPEQLLAELRRLAEVVDPPALPQSATRDPDDDAVLALAVASGVDFIVSGDADLLSLHSYAQIPILGVADVVALIEK